MLSSTSPFNNNGFLGTFTALCAIGFTVGYVKCQNKALSDKAAGAAIIALSGIGICLGGYQLVFNYLKLQGREACDSQLQNGQIPCSVEGLPDKDNLLPSLQVDDYKIRHVIHNKNEDQTNCIVNLMASAVAKFRESCPSFSSKWDDSKQICEYGIDPGSVSTLLCFPKV